MTEVSSFSTSSWDDSYVPVEALPFPSAIGWASFPDSLAPAAPPEKSFSFERIPAKPPIYLQALFSFGLVLTHAVTFVFQACFWLIDAIYGMCQQKQLYIQLHEIAYQNDLEILFRFLSEQAEKDHIAGYLMKQFLDLPELHPHLVQILQGANVRLENEEGVFCRIWSQHPEAHVRISSHQYQGNQCYQLGYFLFWLDLEGNTRFQFENHPLKTPRDWIFHWIDLLRYKRDNQQQGVVGTSHHTEHYCLTIPLYNLPQRAQSSPR